MTIEFTPEKVKEYFEKVSAANTKAVESEVSYLEGLYKRSGAVYADIFDTAFASVEGLKGIKTFTEAFDSSVAYGDGLKAKLTGLYEDNSAATESLVAELKELYTVDAELAEEVKKAFEDAVATAKQNAEEAVAKVKAASEEVVASVKKASEAFVPAVAA